VLEIILGSPIYNVAGDYFSDYYELGNPENVI
jgi:hypothetical protein